MEYNNYSQYCENRLPCGVCKLTNQQCPKYFGGEGFTNPYGSTTATASPNSTLIATNNG